MDEQTVHRLQTTARAALDALEPYEANAAGTVNASLRAQGFDADLVAAMLTQSRLRTKAAAKLGTRAREMLLTPDGLEQATRPVVAARHALHLRAAGVEHVWDFGCGIGLDALAFAEAGLGVTAVESDPVTAVVARANLADWPAAEVVTGDLRDVAPSGPGPTEAAWFDPARRRSGAGQARDATGRAHRVHGLDQISPPWPLLQEIAARFDVAGAKMSPAFDRAQVPHDASAAWVSVEGSLLECVLWWGRAGTPEAAGATTYASGQWHHLQPKHDLRPNHDLQPLHEGNQRLDPPTEIVGRWLYEPDSSVVQAGLVGDLAEAWGGAEVGPNVGYIVSDQAHDSVWARRFNVLEEVPTAPKRLRAWARAAEVDNLVLKKRGVPVDIDHLHRAAAPKTRKKHRAGQTHRRAIVIITSWRGATVGLHVEPA